MLLHHVIGEVNGKRGQWGHAVGGMGAITQAMAAEALARGVKIFTGAAVKRVAVRDGGVRGIELVDGREISACRVAANVEGSRVAPGPTTTSYPLFETEPAATPGLIAGSRSGLTKPALLPTGARMRSGRSCA